MLQCQWQVKKVYNIDFQAPTEAGEAEEVLEDGGTQRRQCKREQINVDLCLVANTVKLNEYVLYFIEYNVHAGIVFTLFSQWFLAKKNLIFQK
jgi:hypothetical protein